MTKPSDSGFLFYLPYNFVFLKILAINWEFCFSGILRRI
jgi:hypothetical protein